VNNRTLPVISQIKWKAEQLGDSVSINMHEMERMLMVVVGAGGGREGGDLITSLTGFIKHSLP
jgi:hypothetical protein